MALLFTAVLGPMLVGVFDVPPASAAAAGPVTVALTENIGSVNWAGVDLFPGQVLQYNMVVANSGTTAATDVTVNDHLPTIDATLVPSSATCGTVPDCTVLGVSAGILSFSLSSVAAGSTGLTLSFQMTIEPKRDILDTADWTGGGCPSTCLTNRLLNSIVGPPLNITSNPPNRSRIPAGTTIDFTLTLLPLSYETGDSNVVTTVSPFFVDGATDPSATTYVAGSASCGATPGCTASGSSSQVSFTFTSAAFAAKTPISVTYAYVSNITTGTLTASAVWSGGTCTSTTCPPEHSISFTTVPASKTSPASSTTTTTKPAVVSSTKSTTTTTTAAAATSPSHPSVLATTGVGRGLYVLAASGLLCVLWGLALLTPRLTRRGLLGRRI